MHHTFISVEESVDECEVSSTYTRMCFQKCDMIGVNVTRKIVYRQARMLYGEPLIHVNVSTQWVDKGVSLFGALVPIFGILYMLLKRIGAAT